MIWYKVAFELSKNSQKIEYLKNGKSVFGEMKSVFHNFLKVFGEIVAIKKNSGHKF